MSRDKTLRSKNTLARHRNVLSRTERIEFMKDTGTWSDEREALGLPKVAHRKVAVGGKEKKKKAEQPAAGAGAATEAPKT